MRRNSKLLGIAKISYRLTRVRLSDKVAHKNTDLVFVRIETDNTVEINLKI